MLQICKKEELAGFFGWLAQQKIDGVPGLYRVIIGNPKARDAAFSLTHGKEPAGLAFFLFVLQNPGLFQDMDLTLGIGNLEAASRYFATYDAREKAKCRTYQSDMNRQLAQFPDGITDETPYEAKRTMQLLKVLPGLRSVLDIHSTDQDSPGMGLDISGELGNLDPLMASMIFQTRLVGITPIQKAMGTKTQPFSAVFGAQTAIELEASQHESVEGLRRSVLNGMSWLANLGCVKGGVAKKPATQDVFTVLASVMVPDADETFEMVDDSLLSMFAPIQKGQVIASNPQGRLLRSPASGLAIFGPDERKLSKADCISELLWITSDNRPIQREILVPECVGHLLN